MLYVGTDQSAQHQQQQQQVPTHNNYSGYNPEQRNSLTSQSSVADPTDGDDDDEDEDDVDGPDVAGGSNFDYFGAAQQQKVAFSVLIFHPLLWGFSALFLSYSRLCLPSHKKLS